MVTLLGANFLNCLQSAEINFINTLNKHLTDNASYYNIFNNYKLFIDINYK